MFARALDIFQGKIKGFQGVSEDKELRENLLKADLKLLIKDIICEVIEKSNNASFSVRGSSPDKTQADLNESALSLRE